MSDDLTRPVALIGSDPGEPPPGVRAVTLTGAGLDDPRMWAERAVGDLDEPVHVVAVADDAPGALFMAAHRTERVVSLVLVDPQVDGADPDHMATMRDVTVPTLVIVSAPTPDSPIDHGQSVAGGVDNGVFVIIDGAAAPTLDTRPESVLEWASAFMSIAEGLSESRTDLITTHDES